MIPSKIYLITYDEFVRQLWPLVIRANKNLAWMRALIEPVKVLYSEFFEFKEEQLYIRSHSAKKIQFENVLNDQFDNDDRRIYIETYTREATSHYYDEGFGDPIYAFDEEPEYLFDENLNNEAGVNFTVFVPEALEEVDPDAKQLFETKLNGEIDRYKIFGTTHKITYYA